MAAKVTINNMINLIENFSVTKLKILTRTITKLEENNYYTIIIPIENLS
jgi:hypothetical protein